MLLRFLCCYTSRADCTYYKYYLRIPTVNLYHHFRTFHAYVNITRKAAPYLHFHYFVYSLTHSAVLHIPTSNLVQKSCFLPYLHNVKHVNTNIHITSIKKRRILLTLLVCKNPSCLSLSSLILSISFYFMYTYAKLH